MSFKNLLSFLRPSKRHLLAVCLLAGTPALLNAQQQPAEQRPQPSDLVATELGKLGPLIDAENWDGALQILNAVAPQVAAGSYDEAIVSQMLAQILLQKGDYAASIAPLERTLELGNQNPTYIEANALLQYTYYLAQLYYQEANAEGKTPQQRASLLQRAIDYIRIYQAKAPKATPEAQQFIASLYYARSQLDPNNIDRDYLEAALQAARDGLTLTLTPSTTFYVLILASLQQLERIEESTEILEILVKKEPTNSNYWQQLAASYLTLAGSEENDSRVLELNVRSIVTILRAQENGHMTESRDYLNLASIYFNIQQFDRAIEVLETGLRAGRIDNELRNWEILAQSYQQLKRELKAIEIFKEALTHFPDAGKLDFSIASIYYTLNNLEAAYTHAASALERGNLENPGQVQQFAAFAAFELKRYDAALAHAQAAVEAGFKDAERLLTHIQNTINERNAALESQ